MKKIAVYMLIIVLLMAMPVFAQQPDAPPCDLDQWLAFIDNEVMDAGEAARVALVDNGEVHAEILFQIYIELAFVRMTLENSNGELFKCGEQVIALNNAGIAYIAAWQDMVAFQVIGVFVPEMRRTVANEITPRMNRIAAYRDEITALRGKIE